MPNCYISITATDRPFSFDVDDNDRTLLSNNFDITAVWPNDSLEENIIALVQAAGVLWVFGEDVFIGSAAHIPTTDGPFSLLISQPGSGTESTHDGEKTEMPSLQVITIGKPEPVARTRAFAVFRALDGIYGLEVP